MDGLDTTDCRVLRSDRLSADQLHDPRDQISGNTACRYLTDRDDARRPTVHHPSWLGLYKFGLARIDRREPTVRHDRLPDLRRSGISLGVIGGKWRSRTDVKVRERQIIVTKFLLKGGFYELEI